MILNLLIFLISLQSFNRSEERCRRGKGFWLAVGSGRRPTCHSEPVHVVEQVDEAEDEDGQQGSDAGHAAGRLLLLRPLTLGLAVVREEWRRVRRGLAQRHGRRCRERTWVIITHLNLIRDLNLFSKPKTNRKLQNLQNKIYYVSWCEICRVWGHSWEQTSHNALSQFLWCLNIWRRVKIVHWTLLRHSDFSFVFCGGRAAITCSHQREVTRLVSILNHPDSYLCDWLATCLATPPAISNIDHVDSGW